MSTANDTVRLSAPWCSCLVRVIDDFEVEMIEPCGAHNQPGPAGYSPGEHRVFVEGSPLDLAVQAAIEEGAMTVTTHARIAP